MKLLDLFAEYARRQIGRVILAEFKHPFLAGVFGTLDIEYSVRVSEVLRKELVLAFILWEILNHDPWVGLESEELD